MPRIGKHRLHSRRPCYAEEGYSFKHPSTTRVCLLGDPGPVSGGQVPIAKKRLKPGRHRANANSGLSWSWRAGRRLIRCALSAHVCAFPYSPRSEGSNERSLPAPCLLSPGTWPILAYWLSGLNVRMPASVAEQTPAESTRTPASSSAQNPRRSLLTKFASLPRLVGLWIIANVRGPMPGFLSNSRATLNRQ